MSRDIEKKRVNAHVAKDFRHAPAAVYRALVEPDLMRRWVWGSFGTDTVCEVDLREGGFYSAYTTVTPEMAKLTGMETAGMLGIFVEIVPERRLVYTCHHDGNVGYNQDGRLCVDEVVRVELSETNSGCRLDFHYLGVPDDGQSVEAHAGGIADTLNHLEKLLDEIA